MDISDKNFKPCPCGYQVCQFCYNNIRQNPELNGRCPACRRPYDDESVEYKIVSPEEWKYEQSKQSRKDRERKQKEKEKKENEQANRKHLAGMRVIQKNLVYVVGLNPPAPSEELHTILRSDKYFGQYGKILKIVINKRNPPPNAPPIAHRNDNAFGVYVTFSKKEEATKCINAIDGTFVDGKPLKAAYGTTKYCSSYLRGQPCPNPNCMFLHEPGEEADSYTRQDLSTRQGLKMGGDQQQTSSSLPPNGLKSSTSSSTNAPYNTRHSNGSQYFNHHKDQEESHHSSGHHTPQQSHAQIHPHGSAQPILGSAPLPPTASWASNAASRTSNVSSPVISSSVLANSSAFPTLAESTTLQQQQHHQQQQARKQKNNHTNNTASDEFNCEYSAISFIDETIQLLNSFPKFDYQIKSDLVDEETLNNFPPLFAFANIKVNNNSNSFNIKLVESLISKPVNRSFSPPPPSSQQSTLQPQQIQQIQQQQQQTLSQLQQPQAQIPQQLTPSQQPQQLNDFAQAGFNQQQQPQQPYFTPQAAAAALLQQQQQQQNHQHHPLQDQDGYSQAQLLQEQLRQQQQQQILLNQLKNERNFANTPPPPGLFHSTPGSVPVVPVQSSSSNDSHSQVGGTASELLNHLMNGKKIST